MKSLTSLVNAQFLKQSLSAHSSCSSLLPIPLSSYTPLSGIQSSQSLQIISPHSFASFSSFPSSSLRPSPKSISFIFQSQSNPNAFHRSPFSTEGGSGLFGSFSSKLTDVLKSMKGLSAAEVEAAMAKVRVALLDADVSLPIVKQFIQDCTEEAVGSKPVKGVTPAAQVFAIVRNRLITLLGSDAPDLVLPTPPSITGPVTETAEPKLPSGILMVGVQGSGKTTTTSKLASRLARFEKRKVAMVSLDTRRPAAQEQLLKLASTIGLPCYQWSELLPGVDIATVSPQALAKAAQEKAMQEGIQVVLYDSAGRMQVDAELMQEIRQVHDIINPQETLLVADSLLGQEAVNIAKEFHANLALTGIILTRVDGDSRGGAALSMRAATGVPIKFVGVGEKATDLDRFVPSRIVDRILGQGDILSLAEKASQVMDEETVKKMLMKKEADFNFLLYQMQTAQKVGGAQNMMSYLPGMTDAMMKMAAEKFDDKGMKRKMALITSMTARERSNPELVRNSGSRKLRIAKGSGQKILDLNRLFKEYDTFREQMAKFAKAGVDITNQAAISEHVRKLQAQANQMAGKTKFALKSRTR